MLAYDPKGMSSTKGCYAGSDAVQDAMISKKKYSQYTRGVIYCNLTT